MIYLILTAVIWGFAFVAQVVAAGHVPMFTFNAIRFVLGTVSLLPIVMIFERKSLQKQVARNTVLPAMLAGTVLFIASSLQQYGVELTQSAGEAGFITGLYTVLVPVFGILLGRKPTVFAACGGLLALTGLYFVSIQGSFSISLGHGVLLLGACFWAWHIIVLDRFAPHCPPLLFSAFQFAFCALLCFPGAFFFETVTLNDVMLSAPAILFGGVMSVGVAYTLQIIGQKRVEPSVSAVVLSSESVFSVVGGALILGEVMSVRAYIGCVLMFAGILVSQYGGRKKKDSVKN